MTSIAANLARVRAQIADAARDAGRHVDDITLIAVSKTYPVDAIDAALAVDQFVFGESTTQEALTKIPHFASRNVEWHFIGHLQSNKVKFSPGNFGWFHSLHSLALAQRLSRIAHERQVRIQVLIEVNAARDPRKHGVMPEQVEPLIELLSKQDLPGIALRGVMGIGPHPGDAANTRKIFALLREVRDKIIQNFELQGFTELSMGMSGDYVDAVREGSTMLRIGTEIFGERIYQK
jgi:pyridoxal phosphate enzyme (YggS family)